MKRQRPKGWKAYPLIKARRIPSLNGGSVPRLVFWCPWCKTEHFHSAGEKPGDGDGHRIAHCIADDSPLKACGYVLWERDDA